MGTDKVKVEFEVTVDYLKWALKLPSAQRAQEVASHPKFAAALGAFVKGVLDNHLEEQDQHASLTASLEQLGKE